MTALLHLPNLLSLLVSVDQIVPHTVPIAQLASFSGLNDNKSNPPSPALWKQKAVVSLWWGEKSLHGTDSPSWEADAVYFQLHGMCFGNPGRQKRQRDHLGCLRIDLT